MFKIIHSFFYFVLCFIAAQTHFAQAQEVETKTQEKATHGIAMHGTPHYGADAKHLDYALPEAPKGGTLKQSVAGSFDTLNAHNIKGKPAAGLTYLYDRLAARIWDEPFSLYGLIAKEIILPEDRSSITFILNDKARFHDKKPITTADVHFSFETLKKYGRPNVRKVYKLVNDVTVKNEKEIKFTFGEGHDYETALIIAMMPILPKHYWEGKDFDKTTLEIPVGSGPYKIKSLEQGRQITYKRVKDYWAKDHFVNVGHHNFNTLIYDYYRNSLVAAEAFKNKAFDIHREFNPAHWQNLLKDLENSAEDKKFNAEELKHQRPEWVRGLIFNTQTPLFNDRKVRRALSLIFDFEWMNKALFHSKAIRITSTFPNTSLAAPETPTPNEIALLNQYKDSLPPSIFTQEQDARYNTSIRQRLRQANELLKQAGWFIQGQDRVHEKTGQKLEFTLTINAAEHEKIALNYAQHLKRLGIIMHIRTVDSAQFVGVLNAYDYDMVLYRWINSLSPGTEQQIYWGCDAAQTNGSRNYARICTPAIDALAASIATARTRQELTTRINALDRALMHEYVMIPLYYLGKDYVAHWNLKHPEKTPLYGMVLETWWK